MLLGGVEIFNFYTTNFFVANVPPVVFISGDGGNMIEAQVNQKTTSNSDCPKQRSWFRVWLNLKVLSVIPKNLSVE